MLRPLIALIGCAHLTLPCSADDGVGGISFRNLANHPMMLYWSTHTGELKRQAQLCANGCSTGFQTYAGHRFGWAPLLSSGKEPEVTEVVPIKWDVITDHQKVYWFTDETSDPAIQQALDEEMAFRDSYYAANQIHWSGTAYPRPPVTLPMIAPTHIGQKIVVQIAEPEALQYLCDVPAPAPEDHPDEVDDPYMQAYVQQCLAGGRHPSAGNTHQAGPSNLTLEVISLQPRVFSVDDFLSTFEADYIVSQARPKLHASTVGEGRNAQIDNTRTSKSAWITRGHSEIMEAIYRRVALVTSLPEELLHESENVESLNVLHYKLGAEYTPHYDWSINGKVASRFLTGLLYLNTPIKGGGTAFPKAKAPNTYLPAQKGRYAFFYDLLEDGNGDVLSLHTGTKVEEGHKWVAPLWIWEPSFSGKPHPLGDLSRRRCPVDESATDEQLEGRQSISRTGEASGTQTPGYAPAASETVDPAYIM